MAEYLNKEETYHRHFAAWLLMHYWDGAGTGSGADEVAMLIGGGEL
jgi:hypothetical protein